MSRLTNQQQRDILERLIGGYLRVTEQMAVKPENINVKMLAWQWGYKALSPAKVDLLRRVLFGLSKHRSEIRRRGGIPEKEDTLNYVYIRMKVTSKWGLSSFWKIIETKTILINNINTAVLWS